MSKILIIPDVHGRTFWKKPCENIDNYDKIVFLGDYVSPYSYEGISNKDALAVFKEILTFKKEHKDKVILLLGNHDFSYLNPEICECRTDYANFNELNKLYEDNMDLFDLAYECYVPLLNSNKRYFFSHAGVRKQWFDNWVKGYWFDWDSDDLPSADYFNNALHAAYNGEETYHKVQFEASMSVYSKYRGWGGLNYGSIVWADAHEYVNSEYDNVVFICGHTQLDKQPIFTKYFMDLDVRQAFILDTENALLERYNEEN